MPGPATARDYYPKQKKPNFAAFNKIGTTEDQAK
jgi:hypothetical protein